MKPTSRRCPWAGEDPLYVRYHDEEWGVPEHDDARLFEMLCLEGAQAGLSWITVLRKRERYREVFHGFAVHRVAAMATGEVERILLDPGVVRNRAKVESTVANARIVAERFPQPGQLDSYLWSFVGAATVQNSRAAMADVPAQTEVSERLSRELRRLGLRFVGPTICYAFMQAVGFVNDHLMDCPRWRDLGGRKPRR